MGSPWWQDSIFNMYWNHYTLVNKWLRQYHISPVVTPLYSNDQASREVIPEVMTVDSPREAHQMDIEDEDNDDSISLDFLDFIRQTREHQADRERRKVIKAKLDSQTVEYRDVTKVSQHQPDATKVDTRHVDNLRRQLQQKQWYGGNALEIQSLEDSLQTDFDAFITSKKPPFFPNCPIHLSAYFDSN